MKGFYKFLYQIEVANALRYLNQLDKMYSGQIRPRWEIKWKDFDNDSCNTV